MKTAERKEAMDMLNDLPGCRGECDDCHHLKPLWEYPWDGGCFEYCRQCWIAILVNGTELLTTEPPEYSPWGDVTYDRQIAAGLWTVSTASHGGIYVAPEWYNLLPGCVKNIPFCATHFYEEDLCWCIPFVAFERFIKHWGESGACSHIESGLHLKMLEGMKKSDTYKHDLQYF